MRQTSVPDWPSFAAVVLDCMPEAPSNSEHYWLSEIALEHNNKWHVVNLDRAKDEVPGLVGSLRKTGKVVSIKLGLHYATYGIRLD